MKKTLILAAGIVCTFSSPLFAKPLKVFILAGQSNMEGYADISTFDYIGKDPATAPILKEMRNPDGTPRVRENVWMSYLTGPADGSANGEGVGNLVAGFGARGGNPTQLGSNIGPELTFGIYMEKKLKEPILIIKTAWGGKSLNTDYRSPSAGKYILPKETQERWDKNQGGHGIPTPEQQIQGRKDKDAATGVYYRWMIEHVKKVLADPKRVCPAYNAKDGYEIAGFVWMQGFNDLVDDVTYPGGNFDEYSRLMAHFIRDVRKDLSAPKMPFVIGVLGVGGLDDNENFRKAMAAPASMPEFKGNVMAVETAPFWDTTIEAAAPKQGEYNNIRETALRLKEDGTIDKDWKWGKYWQPIGKVAPEEQTLRFINVTPTEKKDELPDDTERRFRDITLPKGLEKWYERNFDDSKWSEGKGPIGKGTWQNGHVTMSKFPSTWGEGEFLIMRSTFEVDKLDYAAYRIALNVRQGFHVYLNGHLIRSYGWWLDGTKYITINLEPDQIKHLKKGKNVLAVYANHNFVNETKAHYGVVDAHVQGITKENMEKLERDLLEVYSQKDRDAMAGSSNQGFHYFGSAKFFAQIGIAFGEANFKMMK